MSEVFYGILVPGLNGRTLSPAMWEPRLSLISQVVGDACMALFPPRADVSSDTAMLPAIAMHISKQVGCALLVEYDTRVGHRAAKLFQSGNLVAELGPHSERFVPLADDGKPALSAEWLHADQLDPDEEYETVQNAIELGLAKIDYCTWEQFKRMLASI